jgi:tRNA-specific 2-thiouridylase
MKKRKVFVGLSGGVDSSVSAALLKKEGYEVIGVFIKVWQPDFFAPARANLAGGCTWKEDRLDAMRVAAKLNIPFLTLDLEKEYKEEVIDYMISEYKSGRTPNPDIMCNKHVKFGAFLDFALKNGADFVATGHYAQIKKIGVVHKMLAGVDKEKDQSYFLWTIKKELLPKILFPVGGYKKTEVRVLAKKYNLATWGKKDSQGLCFVGKLDIKDFLKHYIKEKKGNLLNENGEVIGYHSGAIFLTEGERHGFTITNRKNLNSALPQYVVSKNLKNNTVTVSPFPKKTENLSKIIKLKDVNIIDSDIKNGEKLSARTRYREKLSPCFLVRVDQLRKTAEIKFSIGKLVSAGQSLVLYKKDVCVGGGVITEKN